MRAVTGAGRRRVGLAALGAYTFDHSRQSRRFICDEPMESRIVRRIGEARRKPRVVSVADLFPHHGGKRVLQRYAGLWAHDFAASLARMA
jgi:hypothetical protein